MNNKEMNAWHAGAMAVRASILERLEASRDHVKQLKDLIQNGTPDMRPEELADVHGRLQLAIAERDVLENVYAEAVWVHP